MKGRGKRHSGLGTCHLRQGTAELPEFRSAETSGLEVKKLASQSQPQAQTQNSPTESFLTATGKEQPSKSKLSCCVLASKDVGCRLLQPPENGVKAVGVWSRTCIPPGSEETRGVT